MALSKPKKLTPYIPLFDRKNTKDPLTVWIEPMMAVEHDEWQEKMEAEYRSTTLPEARKLIAPAFQKEMFLAKIKKVENYFDEDGITPIKDVEQFYKNIDLELRAELTLAYKDHGLLKQGERKNS